ncbi:hypothetical protein CN213_16090 [Sinorhizobium meliloti]|uniref:hypothetical protein n=1 Tax=Rhizobium meliloti TaxID=382 RepID=UPI000FD87C5A|nr:hypothetical protein [Sinorhizobium meliloti]RVH56266.1 hypothetical protein CN213_16090 [Sinorhizobium meliloti]
MSGARDGGPAFPLARTSQYDQDGMSLRAYLAAHAPVTFEMACRVFGDKPESINLHDDTTRGAFLAVWALLRREYADAVLAELEGGDA